MYREGPTFGENKIVQAGVLDDMNVLDGLEMEVELFAPQRVRWVGKMEGTEDKYDMN